MSGRDAVSSSGALTTLLEQLDEPPSHKFIGLAMWTLLNLCENKPEFAAVSPMVRRRRVEGGGGEEKQEQEQEEQEEQQQE